MALPVALPRAFYERPTRHVARDLLGKILVRGNTHARIVEVEAYLGERDAASHARFGPTPRAAIMFGPPGRLYVYMVYGMHHCANVVCERDGVAGAVLLRAAEPMDGGDPSSMRGPGKLCKHLGIRLGDKGLDLTSGTGGVFLLDDGHRPKIRQSPRIGVAYAGDWARRELRFFVPDSVAVSGPRALIRSRS